VMDGSVQEQDIIGLVCASRHELSFTLDILHPAVDLAACTQ